MARHPAVLECPVVAVPDEEWGERPPGYIVETAGRIFYKGEAILVTLILAQLRPWVTIIQGAIVVVCVLAFRSGIVGELLELRARARRRPPAAGAAYSSLRVSRAWRQNSPAIGCTSRSKSGYPIRTTSWWLPARKKTSALLGRQAST